MRIDLGQMKFGNDSFKNCSVAKKSYCLPLRISRGHDMALLQKLVRAPSVTCSPTELPVTLPKIR